MKKLKLDQSNFAGAEVLSRAELKKVMGGNGSGYIVEGCDDCLDADGNQLPVSRCLVDPQNGTRANFCGDPGPFTLCTQLSC